MVRISTTRECDLVHNGLIWFICPDEGSNFNDEAFFISIKGFCISYLEKKLRSINNWISFFTKPLHLGDASSALVNAHIGNSASKRKRERPQYSHYRLQGHIINRCYKLHGYPLRYKANPRLNWARPKLIRPFLLSLRTREPQTWCLVVSLLINVSN